MGESAWTASAAWYTEHGRYVAELRAVPCWTCWRPAPASGSWTWVAGAGPRSASTFTEIGLMFTTRPNRSRSIGPVSSCRMSHTPVVLVMSSVVVKSYTTRVVLPAALVTVPTRVPLSWPSVASTLRMRPSNVLPS